MGILRGFQIQSLGLMLKPSMVKLLAVFSLKYFLCWMVSQRVSKVMVLCQRTSRLILARHSLMKSSSRFNQSFLCSFFLFSQSYSLVSRDLMPQPKPPLLTLRSKLLKKVLSLAQEFQSTIVNSPFQFFMVILVSLLVDYERSLQSILLNYFILLSYLFDSQSPIPDMFSCLSPSVLLQFWISLLSSFSPASNPISRLIFVVLGMRLYLNTRKRHFLIALQVSTNFSFMQQLKICEYSSTQQVTCFTYIWIFLMFSYWAIQPFSTNLDKYQGKSIFLNFFFQRHFWMIFYSIHIIFLERIFLYLASFLAQVWSNCLSIQSCLSTRFSFYVFQS